MPRGEKAGNADVKPHRARRIAEGMMRRGATRAVGNRMANAAMDREYASKQSGNPRRAKSSFDEEAHDSRTGQSKTNLTTKRGIAESAGKPSTARHPGPRKRDVKATGREGKAATQRRPRAGSSPATHGAGARQSATGRRPPRPRKAGVKQRAPAHRAQ